MRYNELMIDLETLGTKTDTAPVMSIGLVAFNRYPDVSPLDDFAALKDHEEYARWETDLWVEPQLQRGAVIDYGTMMWWMQRVRDQQTGIDVLFDPQFRRQPHIALEMMTRWVNDNLVSGHYVWSNDMDFDISIMEALAARFDISNPFGAQLYRRKSSFRTETRGYTWPEWCFGDHTAGGDALAQARMIQYVSLHEKRIVDEYAILKAEYEKITGNFEIPPTKDTQ